jgi:hypothetical protein
VGLLSSEGHLIDSEYQAPELGGSKESSKFALCNLRKVITDFAQLRHWTLDTGQRSEERSNIDGQSFLTSFPRATRYPLSATSDGWRAVMNGQTARLIFKVMRWLHISIFHQKTEILVHRMVNVEIYEGSGSMAEISFTRNPFLSFPAFLGRSQIQISLWRLDCSWDPQRESGATDQIEMAFQR